MNAGLYTHMNMGAIHAQWIWRSFAMVAWGMPVCMAAVLSAKPSQFLDSCA